MVGSLHAWAVEFRIGVAKRVGFALSEFGRRRRPPPWDLLPMRFRGAGTGAAAALDRSLLDRWHGCCPRSECVRFAEVCLVFDHPARRVVADAFGDAIRRTESKERRDR